jgi:CO dehydrogenase maturation factor
VKVTVAGKGGVGKTTVSALLARILASRGARTLAVDCDPNPTLGEELGVDSAALDRFTHKNGLRRAGNSLALVREPALIEVEPRLWLLGGPPSGMALADAVARGIAGVLLAERFDSVITDLGPGPELAGTAVGGVLNPADLCVVLCDGTRPAEITAERIEGTCRARGVASLRVLNRRGDPEGVARDLARLAVGV